MVQISVVSNERAISATDELVKEIRASHLFLDRATATEKVIEWTQLYFFEVKKLKAQGPARFGEPFPQVLHEDERRKELIAVGTAVREVWSCERRGPFEFYVDTYEELLMLLGVVLERERLQENLDQATT